MNNIMQLPTLQLAAANFVTDVGCGPVTRPCDAARFAAAIDAAYSQLAAAGFCPEGGEVVPVTRWSAASRSGEG